MLWRESSHTHVIFVLCVRMYVYVCLFECVTSGQFTLPHPCLHQDLGWTSTSNQSLWPIRISGSTQPRVTNWQDLVPALLIGKQQGRKDRALVLILCFGGPVFNYQKQILFRRSERNRGLSCFEVCLRVHASEMRPKILIGT